MDKKILFNNISFMVKELGKKVGELELQAGVSPGYISRTSKDENTKPGIEFVVNVAKALNVSIDTLLKVDLSTVSPTERYLISFIEKLTSDTLNNKLDWQRETAEYLNQSIYLNEHGICSHRLFTEETFFREDETEFPEQVTEIVFNSHSYGYNTYIEGDCFNLRMKNGMFLYVMNVSKWVHKIVDTTAYAKELWMCTCQNDKKFLCSTRDISSETAMLIEHLYNAICENEKHPKLNKDVKNVIDAFMNDDMEDDKNLQDWPF